MTSSPPVIIADRVSKRYRIYPRPLDRLRDALGWPAQYKEFFALDALSFEVHKGEFWGIVGRNGSGKSTLLKIIAGQLEPTAGTVSCRGKVALLQLGLGFDPELTGLENIKQSRLLQTLASDYDEVVHFVQDFSEIGDFINYPVKTYSSGMYSRLAFATAIAGDPDLLIADEILAVGDMSFSQKCLAKMREFKEKGKTVILVTHDVNAVKAFCDRALWLNDGRLITIGGAKMVAEDFRNFMLYGVMSELSAEQEPAAEEPDAPVVALERKAPLWITPNLARRTVSTGMVKISKYRFLDWETKEPITIWQPGRHIAFEIIFEGLSKSTIHSFGFTFNDRHGLIALHLNSGFFGGVPIQIAAGQSLTARFRFDVPPLMDGDYSISFGCSEDDSTMIEKYDHDSSISIIWPTSPVTERQGGYVIISSGAFEYAAAH